MYHVQYKWKAKTSWYKSEIRVAVIESAHEFAKTFPTVFLILISYCRITITVRLNKIDQINQLFINLDITMVLLIMYSAQLFSSATELRIIHIDIILTTDRTTS